jgi:hypothetical protein
LCLAVQIGSHYHFIEANPYLIFDRQRAYGMRLNIPAGTAVRFEVILFDSFFDIFRYVESYNAQLLGILLTVTDIPHILLLKSSRSDILFICFSPGMQKGLPL